MYDPTIGRWTTEDPIRLDAEDINLYRYVGNNPTNATDPSGLEPPPHASQPPEFVGPPYKGPKALDEQPLLRHNGGLTRGNNLWLPPTTGFTGARPRVNQKDAESALRRDEMMEVLDGLSFTQAIDHLSLRALRGEFTPEDVDYALTEHPTLRNAPLPVKLVLGGQLAGSAILGQGIDLVGAFLASPQGQAALRMVGGALEVSSGLLLMAAPTGVSQGVGALMILHGADTFIAGVRSFDAGEEVQSLTGQGLTETFKWAGADKDVARERAGWVEASLSCADIGLGGATIAVKAFRGVRIAGKNGKIAYALVEEASEGAVDAATKQRLLNQAGRGKQTKLAGEFHGEQPYAPNKVSRSPGSPVGLGEVGCFGRGTPLMVPGGWKPIEEFCEGDLILSADEHDPDGRVRVKRVRRLFRRVAVVCVVRVQARSIRMTGEHPIYVEGHGWVVAHALRPGQFVRSHDGQWVAVEGVEESTELTTVYNLEVEDYHTFFVGSGEWGFSVWVHNQDAICALHLEIQKKLAFLQEQEKLNGVYRSPHLGRVEAEVDELVRRRNALIDQKLTDLQANLKNHRLPEVREDEIKNDISLLNNLKTIGPDAPPTTGANLRRGLRDGEPSRGIIWREEAPKNDPTVRAWEEGAPGRRPLPNGNAEIPALAFDNPNPHPRARDLVQFDGGLDNVVIDRKVSVTTRSKQLNDLQRISKAVKQNHAYKARIEVPTEVEARRVRRILQEQGITNIDVVVP